MKNILLLVNIIVFPFILFGQETTIKLPELGKEIAKMRDLDQKYRKKRQELMRKGKMETKKFKEVTDKANAIDQSNTARMQQIIKKHGWPTYDLVGKEPSHYAFVIVQHADLSPRFQEKCLALLKTAVDNKQANPSNYAYLYDRVQVAKGEKQRYATQHTVNSYTNQVFFQAIEDEKNVQNRREEMGIEQHIEDYAKDLNFEYKIPSPGEALERALVLENTYKTNIEKARQAMKNKEYESAANYYIQASYCNGSIQTEDLVETARAISLGQHQASPAAFYFFLMKAAFRGSKKTTDFDTDEDFKFIKEINPNGWNDLMKVIVNY